MGIKTETTRKHNFYSCLQFLYNSLFCSCYSLLLHEHLKHLQILFGILPTEECSRMFLSNMANLISTEYLNILHILSFLKLMYTLHSYSRTSNLIKFKCQTDHTYKYLQAYIYQPELEHISLIMTLHTQLFTEILE